MKTIMKFSFMNHMLSINNKVTILPKQVIGAVYMNDILLIIVVPPNEASGDVLESNIFAFNKNGDQVWKIQETKQVGSLEEPFGDISLRDDGNVIAGTIRGYEYIVNIEDGSITPTGGRPW